MRRPDTRAILCPVRLRCLIVDDNEPFLEIAAASLAGESLDVVGTATTSAEALRHVAEHQPDVVLVDINLGDESGFELARKLVERFPQLASGVVLISTRAEQDNARRKLRKTLDELAR